MLVGPILARELLAASRQAGSYAARVMVATLLLVALGANYYAWEAYTEGIYSINHLTWFSRSCFCSLVGLQAALTVGLVPGRVGGAIAEQRERKTLHYLLASELTSLEIVVGTLAARLLQFVAGISAGLPVLALLTLMGGIEPRWVWLAYGGTLSTAFFLGGVAILTSTLARRGINAALVIALVWLIVPVILTLFGWFGALPRWLRPAYDFVREIVLPSSPTGIALSARSLVLAGPWALIEAVARMAGYQLVAGLVCILLAVWRLRPTFRALEAAAGRDATARQRARRWRRACGDDSMLWKETHPPRPGRVVRWLDWGFRGLVTYGVLRFLWDFAGPLLRARYGGMDSGSWTALNQSVFAVQVRSMTAMLFTLYGLVTLSHAACGVTSERERDTWDSLIATPLSAGAIVRAKMLGAAWRTRWVLLLMGTGWGVGWLAGVVPTLGLLTCLATTLVFMWFIVALGTLASLVGKTTSQASGLAGVVLLVTNMTGPLIDRVLQQHSILTLLGCMPVIEVAALLPVESVEARIVPAVAANLIGYGLGAAGLTWAAIALFDRAVGRPHRDRPISVDPNQDAGTR